MSGRLAVWFATWLRWACVCAGLSGLMASAQAAQGTCLGDKPLRGVNIAGGEFNGGRLPGKLFKDYTYPTAADLKYFADQGANAIRVPFRWERVQRVLARPLDANEVAVIGKVIDGARELGLCVILDAHNFGTYATQPLGAPMMPSSVLSDLWLRLREAFPEPDNVAFGLMNEPANAARADWAKAAQDVVTELRKAGSKHLLLVSGAGWSGAHDWSERRDGLSNADAFAKLNDPLRRSVIEVHQYADKDASGTHNDCIAPAAMQTIMKRVTEWAKTNNQRLFLGEFGVAPTPECLDTLKAQLEAARGSQWAGWTYWSAGAWWGPTYAFGVHPINGVDRPQLAVLKAAWGSPP